MTFAQEFAVSCLSASLAHIPHHPLYTLKSQMMFYGRDFSLINFMRRTKHTKGTFLFQGLYVFVCTQFVNTNIVRPAEVHFYVSFTSLVLPGLRSGS